MHRNTLSRTISELKIDVRQLRDGVQAPTPQRPSGELREEDSTIETEFSCQLSAVSFQLFRSYLENRIAETLD